MIELAPSQFGAAGRFLPGFKCDPVLGYTIVERRQTGRIFVDHPDDPRAALFWHYSGCAILAGGSDNDRFAGGIQKLLTGKFEDNQKRFALIVDDEGWNGRILDFARGDGNIIKDRRIRFRLDRSRFSISNHPVPAGFELKAIDETLLGMIRGGIVPSYIWDSPRAFLSEGKGFCMMEGGDIACTAFSSYIGNRQVDIGIETAESYRRRGLGAPTAAAMVAHCLERGLGPDWGCAATNTGSQKIAQKLGFEVLASHPLYIWEG